MFPTHPLANSLGPDWRWLHEPSTVGVVVLHDSGLWVEFSDAVLDDPRLRYLWSRIGLTLLGGVEEGVVGRHIVEVDKDAEEGLIATLKKV